MYAMQLDKRKQSLKVAKEEVKLPLFADIIVNLETPR